MNFATVSKDLFLLLCGSTVLEESWLPHVSVFFFMCGSITKKFYGLELLAPHPTPNLEDQWTTLSLAPTVWPVWLWWTCQELTLLPT